MAVILIIILLGLAFAPSLWAKYTLRRYSADRPDFPGNGAQLAEHLVAELGLEGVVVERADKGSHYDPDARAVRLEPRFYDARSVSAVAVAAHEVGHALQHHLEYGPLITRHKMVTNTVWIEKFARTALYISPFAGLLGRHPGFTLLTISMGVLAMGIGAVVHTVTLPVEFDASFGRALPILERGKYLDEDDMPAARAVLRACALTYVAAALMSMFNLLRWIRVLR